MITGRAIWVTFSFEGFHCWPDAPDEVDWLRARHRHTFQARVDIEVGDSDRELEFVLVKRALQAHASSWGVELGAQSCEMLAEKLALAAQELFGERRVLAQVSEDGENGGVVLYEP